MTLPSDQHKESQAAAYGKPSRVPRYFKIKRLRRPISHCIHREPSLLSKSFRHIPRPRRGKATSYKSSAPHPDTEPAILTAYGRGKKHL